MIAYLDTSVLLRILLKQENRLDLTKLPQEKYSSELLGIECRRAIDRLRLESKLGDEAVARTMASGTWVLRRLTHFCLLNFIAPLARLP